MECDITGLVSSLTIQQLLSDKLKLCDAFIFRLKPKLKQVSTLNTKHTILQMKVVNTRYI